MKMTRKVRRIIMERKIVERLILKKSFNSIAKELNVCKKTIRTIFDMAKASGYLDGKVSLPMYPEALFNNHLLEERPSPTEEKLLPYLDWLREKKEIGWHITTMWEECPEKLPKTSFFRFCRQHGINREGDYARASRVIPEIIHSPGEALILDWGKLCDVRDNDKKVTIYAFAGIMGFSRYLMVKFVKSNSVEETLNALKDFFAELGGVPLKITSDNPKCFAHTADYYEPILNIGFERFSSHYGFLAELLPPRSPEKKGKVERIIPYIRRLYESHGEWQGLKEAQQFINEKLKLANMRKHGSTGKKPFEEFVHHEAMELKKLPVVEFLLERYASSKVRQDGHVRFEGKYYSLNRSYIGKEVFMIGNQDMISIYFKQQLIETHQKIKDGYRMKSTKREHLRPAEQIMDDYGLYVCRAEKIGPSFKELIEGILLQGHGYLDLRKIWGLLNLDKKYLAEEIELASKRAVSRSEFSYVKVKSYLEVNRYQLNRPLDVEKSGAIYKRPIEVYVDRAKKEKLCQ